MALLAHKAERGQSGQPFEIGLGVGLYIDPRELQAFLVFFPELVAEWSELDFIL
jgi:hypothetical protein